MSLTALNLLLMWQCMESVYTPENAQGLLPLRLAEFSIGKPCLHQQLLSLTIENDQ